jgi:hypothetical protein
MKNHHANHRSNGKMLAPLDNIIELWRSKVFFFAHLGFSQWEVEAKPKEAKPTKVQSIHSANTRK